MLIEGEGKIVFPGYCTGIINGVGQYGFVISVIDGEISGGNDTFRIRIWEKATNAVIYDNGADYDTSDPLTPLGGGNVKIDE